MKFSPTFLFYNIEVYDPLIRNLRVWASDKRVRIFSRASKLANSSQNVRHSTRGQNIQIRIVDIIRCVKPTSHHSIYGEKATEWEVFRYRRACLSELQNTTYTESTVLLIFSKDEVRRAHCMRFVRIHRPKCKATNVSVLSRHFEQSFHRRLLNSGDPLQWRFSGGTLESSHEQDQTERERKFHLK